MKALRRIHLVTLFLVLSCSSRTTAPERLPAATDWMKKAGESVVLVGLVPGAYAGKAKTSYQLARIDVEKGVIKSIKGLSGAEQVGDVGKVPLVELKRGSDWDVVYPAMINLHNHTKQNNIGLWGEAKGQFQNRFEWRTWGPYTDAVSFNINPWIAFGAPSRCAAFRWSELSALALGTVYLQGDTKCVNGFAIHRVEDSKAFRADKGVTALQKVRAPTDLVFPNEMTIVWEHIRPRMLASTRTKTVSEAVAKGATYAKAFREVLHDYCPGLNDKVKDVFGDADLKVLNDKAQVVKACTNMPATMEKDAQGRFIRYVERIHATSVAPIVNYLAGKKGPPAAVISHLGEGGRLDPYNQVEFEILQAIGLDLPKVNLIHGVGVDNRGFARMKKQQMGLIWSPWSNFLLYGETADVLEAKKAGVEIALGSDWQPTGSKGVLEELKIARRFLRNAGKLDPVGRTQRKLDATKLTAAYVAAFGGASLDEELYKMVTENPARMIGHLETDPKDGRHGVGTIAPDAAASLVVLAKNEANPYTNLVLATEADVNLVLVDGVPQYGNESYLTAYLDGIGLKLDDVGGEELSQHLSGVESLKASQLPRPPKFAVEGETEPTQAEADDDDAGGGGSDPANARHMKAIAESKAISRLATTDDCNFKERKLLLSQNSKEKSVVEFEKETKLNLDRYADIQKWIGVNIVTQSMNAHGQGGAKVANAARGLTPLLSCNDPDYRKRFEAFIEDNGSGELAKNQAARQALRDSQGHDKTVQSFVETYTRK